MPVRKILIAVKTYPTLSSKYDELVCTAGFLEDGSWIRVYPIQFRKRAFGEQYKKYDWVEIDLERNTSDFRPETYRPKADTEFHIVGHLDTKRNWAARKQIVLKHVHFDLEKLIAEAKDIKICTSLAVFKPKRIIDFVIESVDRDWSKEKLLSLNQMNIFNSVSETTGKAEVVRKIPYKFSYQFEDCNGVQSTMMIEDWEIGQLYWNCLKDNEGNEHLACEAVKQKYFYEFVNNKDLHLFLGTTKAFHKRSRNPFIIIGVFYPEKELVTQTTLFD